MNCYEQLSDSTKGFILIGIGALLLFNAVGLFADTVKIIIALLAIAAIIKGVWLSKLHLKIKKLVDKKDKSTK